MKGRSPTFSSVPLDIVGSTKFGRYPKISVEQTFNMIISDNWLVPYAGYEIVAAIQEFGEGRGIYRSSRTGDMYAVIDNGLYQINSNLSFSFLKTINSDSGDVFFAENNANQLAICDKAKLYIFNYETSAFATATLPAGVVPGYVTFQDGFFIIPDSLSANWYLSKQNDGLIWNWGVGSTPVSTSIQTKPDKAVAAVRFPGRGNLLLVFGFTVAELWQDVGSAIFPYQRNPSINIDYGCLNQATIAFNENIVVWLAANEKSGPVIVFTTGGDVQKISTDGIDFQFTQLKDPTDAFGFLFKQDGHLLYQITFPTDNLSYVYDFNTNKFFTLSNKDLDAHIARRIAFFGNSYYFVSYKDGNLYEMSTRFTTYDGEEIPRIRICRNIRLPDSSRFGVNNLTFTIEQGTQDNIFLGENLLTEAGEIIYTEDNFPIQVGDVFQEIIELGLYTEDGQVIYCEDGRELLAQELIPIDLPVGQEVILTVSKNGGENFSNGLSKKLNNKGHYKNRLIYWNLGACNDFVPQFRFYGLGRFVATDGLVNIYQ